jgi:uncharacterized protein YxeA
MLSGNLFVPIIKKENKESLNKSMGKNKIIAVVVFIFLVLIIISYLFFNQVNVIDGFTNNDVLEQKMFQKMTDSNKQIYLEMSDENKQKMFNNWKK